MSVKATPNSDRATSSFSEPELAKELIVPKVEVKKSPQKKIKEARLSSPIPTTSREYHLVDVVH